MGKIVKERGEPKDSRNIAKSAAIGGLAGLPFGPQGVALTMATGIIKEMLKDPRTPQRKFEDDAERYLKRRYPSYDIKPQHLSKTGKSMSKG